MITITACDSHTQIIQKS